MGAQPFGTPTINSAMDIFTLANDGLGFIVLLVTATVGAIAWVHRMTKGIAKGVAKEVSETLEDAVSQNTTRIAKVEDSIANLNNDLDHHKRNQKQEKQAFERRQDKFEEELRNVTQSVSKLVGDFHHAQEVQKLESKMKLDAMQRIEDGQKEIKSDYQTAFEKLSSENRDAVESLATSQRLWNEQFAASIREQRDVTKKP